MRCKEVVSCGWEAVIGNQMSSRTSTAGSHFIVKVEAVLVIGLLGGKSNGARSTASMCLLSRAWIVSVDDLRGTGEPEAAQLIGVEAATATAGGSHPFLTWRVGGSSTLGGPRA